MGLFRKNKNIKSDDFPTQKLDEVAKPAPITTPEIVEKEVIKEVEKDFIYALYSEYDNYVDAKTQIIIDQMIVDLGFKLDTTNSAVFGLAEDTNTDSGIHLGSRLLTREMTLTKLNNASLVDDLLLMEKAIFNYNDLNGTNCGSSLGLVSIDADGVANIINVGNVIMYLISGNDIIYQNPLKDSSLSVKDYFGQIAHSEIPWQRQTINKGDILIILSADLTKVIMPHNISLYLSETKNVKTLDQKFRDAISYHKKYSHILDDRKEPYCYSYLIVKVNKSY